MLKKIQPNFYLSISRSIIYYMGTWPPCGRHRKLYIIYTVCSFMFMLGILLITEVINLALSLGDMPKMVAGATLLMTNCTHAYKIIVILCRQKRIRSLLGIAKCAVFTKDDLKYEHVLLRYTWQGIFHYVAYQSFGAMAVLCWGFAPIADLVAGRARRLPMEGWYPYNVTATPAFEITSSHQGIAITIACFHNVAMDTLVTGLITVACCQLTLLNENLASISHMHNQKNICGIRNMKKADDIVNNAKSYEALNECVRHSNTIFHFVEEIQDIFSTAIFLQFFVNCIIICLIAFNITQMNIYIPSVLIGMSMYMCCMTYQIFIYCWHGNELRLHSENIIFAAYSGTWWHATESFKRSIQIIMTRAHRPLIFKAGHVMSLSLQTFVRILRMSYSIFTVLQNSTEV